MVKKFYFVIFNIIVAVNADSLKKIPEEFETCTNVNGTGECVPYYLCLNGKIDTFGVNVLDIHFNNVCTGSFDICCGVGQVLNKTESLRPKQNKTFVAECGVRRSEGILPRTAMGDVTDEAEYGEFPWMVAVLTKNITNAIFYACGGSLIAENVILTAAHCVKRTDVSMLTIRVGEYDTQTTHELYPQTDHEVDKVVIHEKFYKGGLHNDIALLFLKNNVEMSEAVSPICLPTQNQIIDSEKCFATGWGKDKFGKEGKYQVILKKIELPIVSHNKCQQNLRKTRLTRRFILHESFMCAGGEEGKDTCQGDGGSPLVCPVDGKSDKYYQAGIVAWGIGCGQKDVPGVYVNVAKFRSWIDQQIGLYTQQVMQQ